jgi:hypothetical protein
MTAAASTVVSSGYPASNDRTLDAMNQLAFLRSR